MKKKAPRQAASRHRGGRAVAWSMAVGVLGALGGCTAPVMVAVGPAFGLAQYGTTTFIRGISTTVFARSLEDVDAAARGVFEQLQLRVKTDHAERERVYFRLEDDRRTDIQVWLTRNSGRITMLEIRVGFWGDEAYSSLLLDQVKQRLSTPAAQRDEAAPPPPVAEPIGEPQPG